MITLYWFNIKIPLQLRLMDIRHSTHEDASVKFPKFLRLIALAEFFQCANFYGIKALLMLFLLQNFGYAEPTAYIIYSLFLCLFYSVPVFCSFLVDELFGFKKMIQLGYVLAIVGQIFILFSFFNKQFFFVGLGFMVIGNSFLKSNLYNLLGDCYASDGKNRIHGYSVMQIAANVAAAIAAVICGYVAYYYGWYYGFAISALNLIISMLIFMRYSYVLGEHGASPRPQMFSRRWLGFSLFQIAFLAFSFMTIVFAHILQNGEAYQNLFYYLAAVFMGMFVMVFSKSRSKRNLATLLYLMLCLMLVFAMDMQIGALLVLFAKNNVIREIFGIVIPAAISEAINPIGIAIIGIIMGLRRHKRHGKYEMTRFILGMLSASFCFFALYYGCYNADASSRIPYAYFASSVMFCAVGAVLYWPFMLTQLAELSPKPLRGFMMGCVMLCIAFSNVSGVYLGRFMSVPEVDSRLSAAVSLAIYSQGFIRIALFNLLFVAMVAPGLYFVKRVIEKNRIRND